MKKRRIFIIGLLVLLLACPSCMIYFTVKQQESYKKKVINSIDPYRIQLLSMAIESKTNPDYSPLSFNGTDEKTQAAAVDAINKIFDAILEQEQSDDGFYYKAYNTKTKQYYKNEKSHYPVIYKKTSIIAKDQKYNDFNLRRILEETEIVLQLDENYKLMDDGRLKVKDVYVNLDQITVNPPNIELTYYCTVYVTPITNNTSRFVDEYDVALLAGIASLLGLILFIFILMNSLEVEESVNPYRTIKNWKLLTVLILIGLTCFAFIGASVGTGILVITGELQNVLAKHSVDYTTSISYGLYFLCVFIFYFLFSMLCFTVKYMFMNGMDYFKNNTCTYALYEKTKELGNKVVEFDLKDNINQDILKFTICNALLVIVLYVLSPSKTIFAIVYVIISFLYIRKQSMKVRNDYKNMLDFTEQLSHGHFDTEIEDDLGIFNSMRDRLNNLKTGFEAAVKEETKSQNMKTELITNVSHDLKTPLTCIKNYVILLKNTKSDEETRDEKRKRQQENKGEQPGSGAERKEGKQGGCQGDENYVSYVHAGVPPECNRRVCDRHENHGDGVSSGNGVFVGSDASGKYYEAGGRMGKVRDYRGGCLLCDCIRDYTDLSCGGTIYLCCSHSQSVLFEKTQYYGDGSFRNRGIGRTVACLCLEYAAG